MRELPELLWDPSMTIGVAELDAQHQNLFALFNAAAHAQAAGATRAETDALIDALLGYTREHFRDEAEWMRKWPLDATRKAMHLAAHARFEAFLRQAQDVAREQPAELVLDLLAYLAQWLLHHVAGVDAQLGRDVLALADGARPDAAGGTGATDAQLRLSDALSRLTDDLVQRTFELLRQRDRLDNLQRLYRALLHSGDVLIQSRSEREMLDSLCSRIVEQTPFHAAWIGRPRDASGLFEVLAMFGDGTGQVDAARPRLTPEYQSSMTVRAWTEQQLLYSNDTLADPLLTHWHEGLSRHRWLSALAVPVRRAGRLWAVLTLAAPRRQAFDEHTVEVCTRIAAMLGRGLDEFDLKARIQSLQTTEASLARTDQLTGLPNRLALDEHLQQALHRAQRSGAALAVGLLDLDDFKLVNDRFGHDAGDTLLRAFGERARRDLRACDYFARLGGDEFVAVFEDIGAPTRIDAALTHLHRAVEHAFDVADGQQASVGMTMGLARYPDDATTIRDLLRAADAAMYQAKLRKHDRATWWRLAGDAS